MTNTAISNFVRGACAGFAVLAPLLASAADPPDNEQLTEVVVTGSRIGRTTFTTPNPVTVIDSQQIEDLGLVNVGEVINQLPQNSNFVSSTNIGLGNFNVGAQLANLRGLNPFFGTRTLTLVDTRRVVPTTNGGGVDLSLIPTMLVGRSEVVTGGGSALYGSDAVAGVVNIILDTSMEGFKAQVDYGQTTRSDAKDKHVSAAWGTKFADGRGHFIIGGEYQDSGDVGLCAEVRSWCTTGDSLFTNTDYNIPGAPHYGQPHYLFGQNGKTAYSSQTGVLVPAAGGPAYIFNEAGTAVTVFNPGDYLNGAFGTRKGGDGTFVGPYDAVPLRPDVERYSILAHATWDFTDTLQGFVETSYANTKALNNYANGGGAALAFNGGPISLASNISNDNAFLLRDAPAVAALIPPSIPLPGGIDLFGTGFGRALGNDIVASNETNNQTWRALAGLKGNLAGSWVWDAAYVYGRNENQQRLNNAAVNGEAGGSPGINDFYNWALDAVFSVPGNTASPIVCRATLPGPAFNPGAAGCVPLNLFGIGHADPAAVAYAFRTLHEDFNYTQQDISVNTHGDLFQGFGAGAIKAAAGLEYRWEKGDDTHDLANQPWYPSYQLSYGLDYSGKTTVAEAYGEVNVPVLKDLTMAKFLNVDAAVRYTKNKNTSETEGLTFGESVTHDFTTWKVSFDWALTDWMRLRGTRSRDARAASFRELYQTYAPRSGGTVTVQNPWDNRADDQYTAISTTAVDLEPEKADTTTVGVVFTPQSGFLTGFNFSADWYQIDLKGAIAASPAAQDVVDLCFAQNEFCDVIEGSGTTNITSVTSHNLNLGSYVTRGVDFEAGYNLPLSQLSDGWQGNLSFRVIAAYLYDMLIQTTSTADPVNYAGQSGPTAAFGGFNTAPEWLANAFITYSTGPFTGTLQARYIGSGSYATLLGAVPAIGPDSSAYDPTYDGSISDNKVPSAVYFNLSASFNLNKHIDLFARVDNLFDKKPVIAPGGNGFPTNPVYFDTLGTSWRIGARLKF